MAYCATIQPNANTPIAAISTLNGAAMPAPLAAAFVAHDQWDQERGREDRSHEPDGLRHDIDERQLRRSQTFVAELSVFCHVVPLFLVTRAAG